MTIEFYLYIIYFIKVISS